MLDSLPLSLQRGSAIEPFLKIFLFGFKNVVNLFLPPISWCVSLVR